MVDAESDIIWGAEAIGRVIGRTPRQIFYMLERGHLPARRVGSQWCASKKKLLAAVTGDDATEAVVKTERA